MYFLSTCTLQPINPSSMSSFQHAPIHTFILFSFFKHIKREKIIANNYIIYAVIIYWETTHVMIYHSCIRTIAYHRIPIATHRNPSQPIATHRNPSQPIANPSSMTLFQHAPMHSFILFSFFKYIIREKFNIISLIIYAVIFIEKPLMLWFITQVISSQNTSSMTLFQHAPMHSFILFSFFKYIIREKFNINIQHL
jgi:hypothetical protein